MIYFPKTRATLSHEAIIAPGAVFTAQGQAAVRMLGATAEGVAPSTGVLADEVFVGFTMVQTSAYPFREDEANTVESYQVPQTGVLVLARAPKSPADVFIFDNTTGAPVPVTGTVTVVGNRVSGLTAGDFVTITYKFVLTGLEQRGTYGDVQPGGYSGDQLGQIGLVTRGTIYTSFVDTGANWAEAKVIETAAGGYITADKGTGAVIDGWVVDLPTTDIPFLGIEFK
ncbi:hypothetical protein [Achromobacter phage Motura]|uniref:Uncharacterized protein n=1 Tax=Achromobacter phage Motura TaxID=2591403 RepID=A0A514CSZ7_9CAUD|nr:virion structural protein [Achromobacter phage Motura]QDH83601.1 hypothetical protein [Achromobacter phage Motura]